MAFSKALIVFLTAALSNVARSSPVLPTGSFPPQASAWLPPGPNHGNYDPKKAVYFLRVDPAGSSIVAMEVDGNGTLSGATSTTSTSGVGLQSINVTAPGDPVTGLDPLQGQQAVSVGDDYLFTINSGSDTAVMFKIDPADPLKLSPVGKPVPTLGEFPMSIAYSSTHKKACVLNGGAINGVTCYNIDDQAGLVPDGTGLRETHFDYTTPPHFGGPKGSGSDILFTATSSKLIAVFKGDTVPATLAPILVFDVDENGQVATDWVDNRVDPLAVAFGSALDGNNPAHIFITDAGFGGGLVSLDYQTNKISLIHTVNDTAFAASCWAVFDYTTDAFYNVDAAAPNLGKINPESGVLETIISYDRKLGGGFDTVVSGGTAYFLTDVNTIAVLSLASGAILQEFTYGEAVDRPTWTGMAMYPASPLVTGGL